MSSHARCPGPQPFAPRSRREFLKVAGCGFGLLGLAHLMARDAHSATPSGPLTPRPVIFPQRPSAAFFYS